MAGEAKFTPGPWIIQDATGKLAGYISIVDEGKKHVADIFPFGQRHKKPKTECEANAHLIAAAPELYTALERAWSLLCDIAGSGHLDIKEQASAALSKARGEPC